MESFLRVEHMDLHEISNKSKNRSIPPKSFFKEYVHSTA